MIRRCVISCALTVAVCSMAAVAILYTNRSLGQEPRMKSARTKAATCSSKARAKSTSHSMPAEVLLPLRGTGRENRPRFQRLRLSLSFPGSRRQSSSGKIYSSTRRSRNRSGCRAPRATCRRRVSREKARGSTR